VAVTPGLPGHEYRHTFAGVPNGTRLELSARLELRRSFGRVLDQSLIRWLASPVWDWATASLTPG